MVINRTCDVIHSKLFITINLANALQKIQKIQKNIYIMIKMMKTQKREGSKYTFKWNAHKFRLLIMFLTVCMKWQWSIENIIIENNIRNNVIAWFPFHHNLSMFD